MDIQHEGNGEVNNDVMTGQFPLSLPILKKFESIEYLLDSCLHETNFSFTPF